MASHPQACFGVPWHGADGRVRVRFNVAAILVLCYSTLCGSHSAALNSMHRHISVLVRHEHYLSGRFPRANPPMKFHI